MALSQIEWEETIKELLGVEAATVDDLVNALKFKLDAEDFVSELRREGSQINIIIRKCHWFALLNNLIENIW